MTNCDHVLVRCVSCMFHLRFTSVLWLVEGIRSVSRTHYGERKKNSSGDEILTKATRTARDHAARGARRSLNALPRSTLLSKHARISRTTQQAEQEVCSRSAKLADHAARGARSARSTLLAEHDTRGARTLLAFHRRSHSLLRRRATCRSAASPPAE